MKVTIKELAKHCDVSIGTIDRVLNNRKGVSPATKEKVLTAVKELNYAPNYLAQSLTGKKTKSIGVVLYNLHNIFFSQLSDAIVSACCEAGYFPYLMLSQKSKAREEEIIRELLSRRIDGLLLFSTNTDEDLHTLLKNAGIPVVNVMSVLKDFVHVGIDDFKAMYEATRYVLNHQYRRVVYISPPLSYTDMNIAVQVSRYKGFQQAVDESGIDHIVIKEPQYLARVDELVVPDITRKKTAFLCSSDVYSMNLVRFMKQKGLNAPFQFGVLGFDNVSTLQYIEPAISTISVPIQEVGYKAVQVLTNGIDGYPMESVLLPHSIVMGQTIV
jgi:LacI family transcriptional regulator